MLANNAVIDFATETLLLPSPLEKPS